MQRCVKLTLVKNELGTVIHYVPKLALRHWFPLQHFLKILNFEINKSILNYRIDTTTWGWNHGSQSSKLVCFKFGLYFCWWSFLWHLYHKFSCNCQIYMVIWVVKFLMGDSMLDRFLAQNLYFLNWCPVSPRPIFDGSALCQL